MVNCSYHVSQEQFHPAALLAFVRAAEDAGFDSAFTSDHLQPWAPQQGHSAFTWSWLGAALQATSKLTFGTISVPGGWRYQPVVLAQAIATLGAMFPGRLPWVALGSGEALNERATGLPWPAKDERNQRLFSSAQDIRELLDGREVTSEGPPATVKARLWCKPAQPVHLVAAATSESTARWLGTWADGLLTTAPDLASLRALIEAFRSAGGNGKPVHVKVDISWAATEAAALQAAHENWRFNGAGASANAEFEQPEDFDEATRRAAPEDIRSRVFVSADIDAHTRHLQSVAALGVDSIDIHNVGLNQQDFIQTFGARVLPALR